MRDGDTTKKYMIRRFSIGRIIEHWLTVIAFTILAVTGLSQKFYSLSISQWIILQLGGIDNARLIHHYTGMLFAGVTMIHIIVAIIGIVVKRWHPSMIINEKDFTDAIHNIRYYVGAENFPAMCDRYDYKQKFEYWGVLISIVVMVISGLALWFPVSVTRFLPGEIIPAAKTLHTNQALIILLIIALWHIYNAILSPEVFPIDTVMFTGKISKERLMREHPLEYDRLLRESLLSSTDNTEKDISESYTEIIT